jgi:hypothetical protein
LVYRLDQQDAGEGQKTSADTLQTGAARSSMRPVAVM